MSIRRRRTQINPGAASETRINHGKVRETMLWVILKRDGRAALTSYVHDANTIELQVVTAECPRFWERRDE